MQNLPTTSASVTNQGTATVVVSSPNTTSGSVTNQTLTVSSVSSSSFMATWAEQLQTWASSGMTWASVSDRTAITNI